MIRPAIKNTAFLFVVSVTLTAAAGNEQSRFVGQWSCQLSYMGMPVAENQVSFNSAGTVNIGGQDFDYSVVQPNQLNLKNRSGQQDSYQYQFDGDSLVLSYHDGSSFTCRKNNGGDTLQGSARRDSPGSPAVSQGGGNEWQLQGSFCNWSGSSSSYSGTSYSSTRRVNFDGRGQWTFGSEASFSGDAGMAYSAGAADNAGSYRVQGSQIYYRTNAGVQGVAQVRMRQNDGRITEIMIDGALYAPQLCE